MRKLSSHVTSVDGYCERPNQAFDWPIVDEEFNRFALRQLEEADTLQFMRVTYHLGGLLADPAVRQDDLAVPAKVNGLAKVVISRRLGTDETMLAVALHLRGQELSLREIAARLVIATGKKKGQHPSPATVLRMLRDPDAADEDDE